MATSHQHQQFQLMSQLNPGHDRLLLILPHSDKTHFMKIASHHHREEKGVKH
jgi:hypothetical protein